TGPGPQPPHHVDRHARASRSHPVVIERGGRRKVPGPTRSSPERTRFVDLPACREAPRRGVSSRPPRQGQPEEKRSRVVEEPSASEPEAAVPRSDGKRKAVTIHIGVSSSEGAGSLRPPKKTVKKVADLEFVPLWLLSKDACRRAAEKETGFKKPIIQKSDGTFVEADESCPDGYVQEGDLDWILWNECTKMQETLIAEHDVDEDVQQMFKKAHHAVRYQLIVNSGSEDPIFDLAVVDTADLDVYVREEETRAYQEQKAKLAAMQAKMDQLVAAAT
ncbi:hypothetical protein CF328_g9343, partial [Tilletia controversa]